MALSQEARKALEIACPQKREGATDGKEVADKIDEFDGRVAAAVADEATVDGSDAATTQALANALKDKMNEVLAALRDAGLMAE